MLAQLTCRYLQLKPLRKIKSKAIRWTVWWVDKERGIYRSGVEFVPRVVLITSQLRLRVQTRPHYQVDNKPTCVIGGRIAQIFDDECVLIIHLESIVVAGNGENFQIFQSRLTLKIISDDCAALEACQA